MEIYEKGSFINYVDMTGEASGGFAKYPYYCMSLIKIDSSQRGEGSKISKNLSTRVNE